MTIFLFLQLKKKDLRLVTSITVQFSMLNHRSVNSISVQFGMLNHRSVHSIIGQSAYMLLLNQYAGRYTSSVF